VIYPNKQEKETLLTQLNLLGAKHVYVEFRGGGDDGQVESVYYTDRQDNHHDIPKDMMAWTKMTYGKQAPETKDTSLVDVLEDLCYRALDEVSLDWCNNEGGQGHLHIDFTQSPPTTHLDIGINTMSTDDYNYDMDELEDE
jgi:hypothetical protein